MATGVGAAFVVGGGVAAASVHSSPLTLPTGINPSNIAQNTHGQETCVTAANFTAGPPYTAVPCTSTSATVALSPGTAVANTGGVPAAAGVAELPGAGSGLTFQLTNSWVVGDQLTLTVSPNNTPGGNCTTPNGNRGVNSVSPSTGNNNTDNGNWVGFSDFTSTGLGHDTATPATPGPAESSDIIGPSKAPGLESFGGTVTPTANITETNQIPTTCASEREGLKTFSTLVLTFTNNGANDGSVVTVNLGFSASQPPFPSIIAPILYDVGFGATAGPIHLTSNIGVPVASDATVTGVTSPTGNVTPTVQRSTTTDQLGTQPIGDLTFHGPIPPAGGDTSDHWIQNTGNPLLTGATAPGTICVTIDNRSGNSLAWGGVPTWTESPLDNGDTGTPAINGATLALPVTASGDANATFTASGLTITGLALADGPVWATITWVPSTGGSAISDCLGIASNPNTNFTLGYVQLTTVVELANSVFGNNADNTALQAINHQFDHSQGQCVTNADPGFASGRTLFLARDDNFSDGLTAAYPAGTVDSGVLLTPPDHISQAALDGFRLQGARTVFVEGGPIAIHDSVVTQLENTPSYLCGGTALRLDETGHPVTLNVVRIFGDVALDTAQMNAQFVGAQPIGTGPSFGAYGGNPFNHTSGQSVSSNGGPGGPVNVAILVTSNQTGFQDALQASDPAYNENFPMIETDQGALSPQALAALFNDHIQSVIVDGGPQAISDNVMNTMAGWGISSIRVAGADFSNTSTEMASFELSASLGLGWDNVDHAWANFVNRTAGQIGLNPNGFEPPFDCFNTGGDSHQCANAHVVLVARGDLGGFTDAMSAGAVLSVHNGRIDGSHVSPCLGDDENFTQPGDEVHDPALLAKRCTVRFPLVLTNSPTDGGAVPAFLTAAGQPVSALEGAQASGGLAVFSPPGPVGLQQHENSSNVFTIQPIGGPVALTPGLLNSLVGSIA